MTSKSHHSQSDALPISVRDKKIAAVFVALLCLFVVGNAYALSKDNWYISAIPVVLGVITFGLLKPLQFWLFLIFLTPFSFVFYIPGVNASINLPTEPFTAFFVVLLVFKFLLEAKTDWRVLSHPITILIIAHLVWMLITCVMSSVPLVSFKYFISRLWYVIVFYFFGIQVFKSFKGIDKFHWAYVLSMGLAIIYSLIRHSQEYFSHDYSYAASRPFFSDHNIYAVIVAFFIPTAIIYFLKSKTLKVSKLKTILYLGLSLIYLIGVVASYTRAAWVSLVVALGLFVAMELRVKLRYMILAIGLAGGVLAYSWTDIMNYAGKNKVESDSNIDEHVQSIYNVTTDDSNTERLNRWSAAVRMFLDRPLFGYGPNSYQFKYAPFQMSYEKTMISTNLGDLGNAHSEFIGPLAEQGLIGFLFVVAIMLVLLKTGMSLYYHGKNERVRYLALMVVLSFMTYYSHGLLNNYLDIDKTNVLFWASMAVLTALSVFHNTEDELQDDIRRDVQA